MFKKADSAESSEVHCFRLLSFCTRRLREMGSSVEGAMPTEQQAVATVLATPTAEGAVPEASRPTEVVNADSKGTEVHPDTSKDAEKNSPGEDLPDENDPDAVRAAKKARIEEIEEQGMDDRELILKCLRYVQSSLEYTARQAQALKECQDQLKEVGAVAYMGESAQKYSLAAVNAAANNVKSMTWQLTGSRSKEKVSCKSLLQQILTNTGKTVGILTKMSESLQKQAEQSQEQQKQFSEVLLQIPGQIADHFARGAAAVTPSTPAAPVFPPSAPTFGATMTGVSPVGVGGYGASAPMQATVPASFQAPALPPPASPAPSRTPVTIQLRQNDGAIQQRLASPTPYRDESLRNNANYVFCDDRTYRRLV
eukprot:s3665_g7.t1